MEIQALSGVTGAFGNPTFSEGTTGTTSFLATPYAVNGKGYTLAPVSNQANTACATQASGTTCLYLLSVAAGSATVTHTKGVEVVTPTETNGVPSVGLELPGIPAGHCPLGQVKIVATAAYTHGTTAMGSQETYTNFMGGIPGSVGVS